MTENGTPQGSVISPLLFIIMRNDVFKRVDKSIHRFLFADDGAQWFRGGNIEYVVQNMQGALKVVEEWSFQCGFKISVKKKQRYSSSLTKGKELTPNS